jgi:hypothetical protein
MINKFQAFNLMRTPEFCSLVLKDSLISDDKHVVTTILGIHVNDFNVGFVIKEISNGVKTYSSVVDGKINSSHDNIMQAFAQVVELFMNAYNEKWKKENRYEVAKEQFKRDIMRNGSFISGDIIYLNDGDYGIVDRVTGYGYELFMNSSSKYHSVMSDGRGVTVFGTLDKNHSLSVDWKKTFITYLDGFQPSVKIGD